MQYRLQASQSYQKEDVLEAILKYRTEMPINLCIRPKKGEILYLRLLITLYTLVSIRFSIGRRIMAGNPGKIRTSK